MGHQGAPRPLRSHGRQIQFAPLNPIGDHVANTDISGVVTLTPVTDEADKLLIQALDQNAFFTLDGTDPIPTGTVVGFMLPKDDPPLMVGFSENTVFKVVQEQATCSLQHQWGE